MLVCKATDRIAGESKTASLGDDVRWSVRVRGSPREPKRRPIAFDTPCHATYSGRMTTTTSRSRKATRPVNGTTSGNDLFGRELPKAADHPGGVVSVAETFKQLYYHLYTNGDSSRAERIVADLALVLLLKMTVDRGDGRSAWVRFIEGKGTAQGILMPVLKGGFPGLVDAKDRFSMGDAALRGVLPILDQINLATAPAHVLGDAFQSLMGPRLRGDKGQFFTPRSLVRAMVRIIAPTSQEDVLDPACGTAGFLCEAHAFRQQVEAAEPSGRLVGIDKDHDLFRLCGAMLSMCAPRIGQVHNQNSLDMAHLPEKEGTFNVVLTNPPFGTKIGVRDREVLAQYDLAHQWVFDELQDEWVKTNALSAVEDPQVLFVEMCVRMLKPGGRLGIVLPEGMFGNKKSGYIWTWLRQRCEITCLLDCPRTTFQPGTDTKTNVLFARRYTADERRKPAKTRIAVAIHCGHDRRGRTHGMDGKALQDDFAAIADEHGSTGRTGRWWSAVALNGGGYLVPRYLAKDRLAGVSDDELTATAKRATIGSLVQDGVLTIRKGHEVGSHAYGTGDIPFIRTSDITNFEISVDPTKSISEEIYNEYARQQRLRAGDIVMVVDGRYRIGATAMLSPDNCRAVVQSHLRIISVRKPDVVSPHALIFALNLPTVKIRLRDLVFVQSTLGTLGSRLLELELPVLGPNGPWTERVARFETLLRQREESLTELRRMAGTEVEL